MEKNKRVEVLELAMTMMVIELGWRQWKWRW